MPNWCSNSFTVSHEDPEMIRKFARGVNEGTLFADLVPLSTKEWDYNAACEEWGTKWDISGGDVSVSEDGKIADGWFETAWSPAIAAYEKLEELGFTLEVMYYEPGMCYAGKYAEGDDNCYEYDFTDPDWRDGIDDADVLEMLECEYENWLMWNEENETEEDGSEDSRR
jgi:hypothetical protein